MLYVLVLARVLLLTRVCACVQPKQKLSKLNIETEFIPEDERADITVVDSADALDDDEESAGSEGESSDADQSQEQPQEEEMADASDAESDQLHPTDG